MFHHAERPRVEAQSTQRPREVRSETVQREDALRLHLLHKVDQVGKIRVVTEGKRRVALITKPAARIDGPARDHGATHRAEREHQFGSRRRRGDDDLAAPLPGLVFLVGREAVAELLIDARHLVGGIMQHHR